MKVYNILTKKTCQLILSKNTTSRTGETKFLMKSYKKIKLIQCNLLVFIVLTFTKKEKKAHIGVETITSSLHLESKIFE